MQNSLLAVTLTHLHTKKEVLIMNKRRVKRKINKKKITITLIIALTILIGAVAAYSHFFNIDNLISQEPTEEELLEQENLK